jgi:phage host-nuclease inhibitor protein Gam
MVEPLISHQDVTTIMRLLADIQRDVVRIRQVLEDEDGEEEAPKDDG